MPPKVKIKEIKEKAAQKKAKAIARKEEKRIAAEERVMTLKKEELQREIKHGELNTKRFRKMWRDMVMRAKMPFIKEDLEVAWHTFDRVLDVKNYSISLLMDGVDEAEEQYQVNERSHIEAINHIFEVYVMRLRNEESNYHKELDELMNIALVETEKIASEQTEDEVFLQAMMFAMEQRLQDFINNVKSGTISKVDELADDHKNLRRLARMMLDKNLYVLWDELCHNVATYLTDTEDRRKIYAIVKAKDDKARRIIARQLVRTAILFETIRKLKEKIAAYKTWADQQIVEIAAEYDVFYAAYWTVKNRFLLEQSTDKAQVTIMTKQYNGTTQNLKRLVSKGEHLLVLIQACRKFETQDEKVLPFAIPLEPEDQTGKPPVLPDWERSRRVLDEFKDMEHFWRRTGAAQVMTTELRLERNKLREEASCLRECLGHCIDKRQMIAMAYPKVATVSPKPVIVEAEEFFKHYLDF